MNKKWNEQILFSCVGSTDPVRGFHDGAMLHIARHYRPAKIQLYITKEMRQLDEKDQRYQRGFQKLEESCPGYLPEILPPYYDDVEDASEFDRFYDHFSEILGDLSRKYPKAEILVNVSSGTPQMKMTLAILAQSLQFHIRVVQVKNFERRSGTSDRTTSKQYDLEMELELNEDQAPDAPNRCQEPQLISIQRENLKKKMEALLRRYDYKALLPFCSELPEQVQTLIHHLVLRADYDIAEAQKFQPKCEELELYPSNRKKEHTYGEYFKLSEYLLTLKLMQRTQRYTDLVIRLNPLVIRMQQCWLLQNGVDLSRLGVREKGYLKLTRDKLSENAPELLVALDQKYPDGFRDGAPSISVCNCMLEMVTATEDKDTLELFYHLETLNYISRNDSAHSLTNVHEEDITRFLGCDSAALIKRLTEVLERLFPQHFRKELFSVYDDANKFILQNL